MAAQSFGYNAATYPGIGICVIGNIRGSVMGSKSGNAWITNFHGKLGKTSSGAATAWAGFALYLASGTTITTKVGESAGTVAVTGTMVNGSTGQVYSKPPAAPIQRWAATSYALVTRSDGGNFNHGQDHSGLRMAKDTGFSFPSPLTPHSNNAEGKMALWVTEYANTPPHTPSNVLPAENGFTPNPRPDMVADFRDDEELLPGFSLGDADKVKKFQFRILSGSTVVADSGVITATAPQQAARRVTWSPTSDITAGDYTGECTVWDMFDTKCKVSKKWAFTIAGGGAMTVQTDSSSRSARNQNIVITGTPGLTHAWEHEDALSTASISYRIVTRSGAVIRGPYTVNPRVLASGSSLIVTDIFSAAGWTALPRGADYRWEVQATDSNAQLSPWSPSPWFWTNTIPSTPSQGQPVSGSTVIEPPTLSIVADDSDSSPQQLEMQLEIGPAGGTKATLPVGYGWSFEDGRWLNTPHPAYMSTNGAYEWRARSRDLDGEYSSWSSTHTLNKVDPPVVSDLSPADEEIVTINTPTISASVDRTVSSWSVTIRKADGTIAAESGIVASGTVSYDVPLGLLKNNNVYSLEIIINTSDGLATSVTSTFTVDYPDRRALLGFESISKQGEFEPTPQQASEIELSWDELPSTNPTIMVLRPGGSEDASGPITPTITGAARVVDTDEPMPGYDEIVEGGKNYVTNPYGESSGAAWHKNTGVIVERVIAPDGSDAIRVDCGTVNSSDYWVARTPKAALVIGRSYVAMCEVWVPAGQPDIKPSVSGHAYLDPVTTRDQWVARTYQFVATSAALEPGAIGFHLEGSAAPGNHFYVREPQIVAGSDVLPFVDPENDPLASWDGTPHASTSTRQRTPSVPAWFIEEGTTNLHPNPYVAVNDLRWSYGGASTTWNGRVARPWGDGWCFSITVNTYEGPGGHQIRPYDASFANAFPITAGLPYTCYATICSTVAIDVQPQLIYWDAGESYMFSDAADGPVVSVPANTPTVIGMTATPVATAAKLGFFALRVMAGGVDGMTLYATEAQIEQRPYATSLCPELDSGGSLKPGYSWAGSAHASASTRAATFIGIAPNGLSTTEGSMVFRVRRENIAAAPGPARVFNWGGWGDPNDHLDIVLSPTGRLSLTATTNGSLAGQVDILGHTAWGATWVGYAEWTPTTLRLVSPLGDVTVPRTVAPTGVVQPAHDMLGLGAEYTGGQHVNGEVGPFAFFDRPLTEAEQSLVMSESLPTIEGLLPFASDAEFGGYPVYRENLETGEIRRLAVLPSRSQTEYVDRQMPGGALHRHFVTYLHLKDNVEWVESAPAMDTDQVELVNLVISDMQVDGRSVPIRWWESRRVTHYTATETVATLGKKPIAFQGLLDYRAVEVMFILFDDPDGTFTAQAHREALEDLNSPIIDAESGLLLPADLCLRDPQGRIIYGSLTALQFEDDHSPDRIRGTFTFVENATHRDEYV